jgi:putative tricarboxylic transport membrane protein
VEGIAAVESANSSCAAGSFAPLLALGIPGSGTTAILLGGLIMWGLSPGPLLFTRSPEFAWGCIASLYVANVVTLIVAVAIIPALIKILSVPIKLIIPMVVTVCFAGAYTTTNSMYGVFVMLASAVLGYFMSKYKYPIAPMLLAYVLAPMLEINMRRAFIASGGSVSIFFTRPISLAFILVFFAFLLFPLVKMVYKKIKSQPR